MSDENPKLFISYSWSSPDHEQWVLNLAEELVTNGVDVTLDKWHLREGNDANAFMEKMVTDPETKKVILVCDRVYVEKADGRKGGVGTEAQIITPEIYSRAEQNKFVAVIVEKDENGNPYVPVYYKSRIHIDLSDDDLYATNFEQLLRWVYDKPVHIRPELGKKPAFLSSPTPDSLGTSLIFKRTLAALRNGKSNSQGVVNEYFETFIRNLENFRIREKTGWPDDQFIENIEAFIPYRNEAIEIFQAIAQNSDQLPDASKQLHRFFEGLLPYCEPPEGVTSWHETDFDNFRFIIQELFLYVIASLLKYERFSSVAYLVNQGYYHKKRTGEAGVVSFSFIRNHLDTLDNRKKRLKLRRMSIHADLLKDRAKSFGFDFDQIMQADFVLFLRDCFDSLRSDIYQGWWPETLLYMNEYSGALEIFARASSSEYFDEMKQIFLIDEKTDFMPIFEAFQERKLRIPSWDFHSINPVTLMAYDELAKRP